MKLTLTEAYERATKGPLKPSEKTSKVFGEVHCCRVFALSDAEVAPANGYGESPERANINAALLAHAFNVLPEVVAALESAKEYLKQMGEDVDLCNTAYSRQIHDALFNAQQVEVPE